MNVSQQHNPTLVGRSRFTEYEGPGVTDYIKDKAGLTDYNAEDVGVHLPGTKPTTPQEKANLFTWAIERGKSREEAIKIAEEGLPADENVEAILTEARRTKNPYRD